MQESGETRLSLWISEELYCVNQSAPEKKGGGNEEQQMAINEPGDTSPS